MRLWAMLTLCCLVMISVCSMNIDASDRFDAQSISDVLNRAKRQTDGRGRPDSNTVEPVLSGHSKITKTKVLKTNGIA